jgi:hypothetical protein
MEIKHKISNGWVYYSEDGITIKPNLYWNTFVISWTEIDFISPIPGIRFENKEWFTFEKINLMSDDALKRLDFCVFDIVVKDYHKLKYGNNFIEKILGYCFFPIAESLINADDKPDRKKACFSYRLKKTSLNVPLRILLNLIQNKNKYGLLGHFD